MAWTKTRNISARGIVVDNLSEVVVNDQDKTLDVATDIGVDVVVEILGIRLEYIADATAATRSLAIEVLDGLDSDNILFSMRFPAGADIVASTTEFLELIPGFGQAFVAGEDIGVTGPNKAHLPRIILGQNHKLRIFTVNGQAADDMQAHIRFVHL